MLRLNVTVPLLIAERCRTHSAKAVSFLYASTDMVFDGQHAPYARDDEPQPITYYGQTKRDAELQLLALTTVDRCVKVHCRSLCVNYGNTERASPARRCLCSWRVSLSCTDWVVVSCKRCTPSLVRYLWRSERLCCLLRERAVVLWPG